MNRDDAIALAGTALAVIVVPGLATGALSALGYDALGTVVWIAGYGLGVLFIWYQWIRPLDLRGPGTEERGR